MSEQITYPQMPDWRNLVSPELLLVYVASTLGELSIDKDARTITMNSTYTYDISFLNNWQSIIGVHDIQLDFPDQFFHPEYHNFHSRKSRYSE